MRALARLCCNVFMSSSRRMESVIRICYERDTAAGVVSDISTTRQSRRTGDKKSPTVDRHTTKQRTWPEIRTPTAKQHLPGRCTSLGLYAFRPTSYTLESIAGVLKLLTTYESVADPGSQQWGVIGRRIFAYPRPTLLNVNFIHVIKTNKISLATILLSVAIAPLAPHNLPSSDRIMRLVLQSSLNK